jgi:hypothetical protein
MELGKDIGGMVETPWEEEKGAKEEKRGERQTQ